WFDKCREVCMDPKTGTLIQALHWQDASLVEYPRASGTFLGIYFLSFAHPEFARELYENAREEFFTTIVGLGAVREYTRDVPTGLGDIDSGPVVFGFGLSPIGFMLGCARIFDDEQTFNSLFGTCYIGGAAVESNDRFNWSTGGSIGDAVMFGMLTTIKATDWENLK
ncbi:MAG: hypothetical protein NE330_19270, partial [Lentisphaeraceae bacterium]|nr:hypothetical protein [Lentisphaeraceae bacterium]